MKKLNFLVLAIFLSNIVSAQIQGTYISAEREVATVPLEVGSVKSATYKDDAFIITLGVDTSHYESYFYLTELGSTYTSVAQLSGHAVYDFKVLGDNIYFCGKDTINNCGFISWLSVEDLFYSGNPFDIYKIGLLGYVHKLTVYKHPDSGVIKMGAIGVYSSNYYYIDMDTENPNSCSVYPTNVILSDVVNTAKSIVVLGSIDRKHFCLFKHYKDDPSIVDGMVYEFPSGYAPHWYWQDIKEMIPSAYVMTAKQSDTSENVLIATDVRAGTFGHQGYPLLVYDINISNMLPEYTYVIPSEGKPLAKNIKYNEDNCFIYLLAYTDYEVGGAYLENDVIYEFKETNSGPISMYVPSSINVNYESLLYGLTLYDNDNYYLVSGINNSSSANPGWLYLFDKKIAYNPSPRCFKEYPSHVYFDGLNPVGPIMYQEIPLPTVTDIVTPILSLTKYSFNCTE